MNRAVKLVGIVLLAGVMAAVIITAAIDQHGPPNRSTAAVSRPRHIAGAGVLGRCRTITSPDAACEAAWDAERRRFFGSAAQ